MNKSCCDKVTENLTAMISLITALIEKEEVNKK